jgi:hypothetical protein
VFKSFAASLVVSLAVALGIATAWSVAVMWSFAMIAAAAQRQQGYELLYVSFAGEPVIVRIAGADNRLEQEVITLGGQPVGATTQQLIHPLYHGGTAQYVGLSGEQWSWRMAATSDGLSPATYWYLVHDGRVNGRAYGIGYHSRSRQVVGYFGTKGFTERMPPREEWFQIAGQNGLGGLATNVTTSEPTWSQWVSPSGLHFLADGKLWSVDPVRRTVRALVDCPRATALGTGYRIPDEPPAPPAQLMPNLLFVHEPERVIVYDPLPGESRAYPLPESLRQTSLAGFELADQRLLLVSMAGRGLVRSGSGVRAEDPGQEAVWIDRAGKVVRREEVRLRGHQGDSPATVAWAGVAAAPTPLAGLITTALVPLSIQESGQANSYSEGLAITLGVLWPPLVVLLAVGAACAIAAWRRQRRLGLPHAAGWAVFAFLLGIPGWIAYRVHRAWPVLEECPACRQPSPRDRPACTECGADYPPPALKGIEVFG